MKCKKRGMHFTSMTFYHIMKLQFALTLTVLSRNLFVEYIKSIKKEGHFK